MMRKIVILASILIALSLTAGKVSANMNDQNTAGSPISVTIPADIYKIISNSCTDCHAKGGKKSAMSHVNFSNWDTYSAEKQAKKAAEMVKMLNKGKMPPKLYRESHPEKVPTPDQIEIITKWAESLPQK
jgi:hypothetical protein